MDEQSGSALGPRRQATWFPVSWTIWPQSYFKAADQERARALGKVSDDLWVHHVNHLERSAPNSAKSFQGSGARRQVYRHAFDKRSKGGRCAYQARVGQSRQPSSQTGSKPATQRNKSAHLGSDSGFLYSLGERVSRLRNCAEVTMALTVPKNKEIQNDLGKPSLEKAWVA
jgi:hypothetical protein